MECGNGFIEKLKQTTGFISQTQINYLNNLMAKYPNVNTIIDDEQKGYITQLINLISNPADITRISPQTAAYLTSLIAAHPNAAEQWGGTTTTPTTPTQTGYVTGVYIATSDGTNRISVKNYGVLLVKNAMGMNLPYTADVNGITLSEAYPAGEKITLTLREQNSTLSAYKFVGSISGTTYIPKANKSIVYLQTALGYGLAHIRTGSGATLTDYTVDAGEVITMVGDFTGSDIPVNTDEGDDLIDDNHFLDIFEDTLEEETAVDNSQQSQDEAFEAFLQNLINGTLPDDLV